MSKDLNKILNERDQFQYLSDDWNRLNDEKAEILEKQKPSLSETIIYFKEEDLDFLGEGPFVHYKEEIYKKLMNAKHLSGRRSKLEYVPEQRHPIPYIYVKDGDRYFFISREGGSGETRLIGKKGMLGGHVGPESDSNISLEETLKLGMLRELEEEAAITEKLISNISLKGLIKSNEGVDNDHLGLVYEVTLNDNNIETQEEGIINGFWLKESEIKEHYNTFENWSKIVIDNVILPK